MDDFEVSFGIAYQPEEVGNAISETSSIRENGPYWADMSLLSVEDALHSQVKLMYKYKRFSAKAKSLIDSERQCTPVLMLIDGKLSLLHDEMRGRSLAKFVEDFKVFRPDEKEFFLVSAYL